MQKFLAIVKREYVQRVRSKMFIVATVLGPLVLALFGVVPALIFSIRAGGPVRIAVVDQSGKIYERLVTVVSEEEKPREKFDLSSLNANNQDRMQQAATKGQSFLFERVNTEGRSIEEIKNELNIRIREGTLDSYLIVPSDVLQEGVPQFFGRNTGDVFTTSQLEDALSDAVREQRLVEASIDAKIVRTLSTPVSLQAIKVGAGGEEKDSGEGFIMVFATGFVIYLTILMYGQTILGAVIEEKETRIAEILFSSVKPFTLMIGKLVGVSLVALTQLAVWAVAFLAFTLYGVSMLATRGKSIHIPSVSPIVFVYFALFFLLGYFIYATIYALVGSLVTNAQEGGQLAMPIILLLVIAFYLAFPVIQSPDSSFAFWVSLFPFFSPITMLVRIVTQTPPFWQIAASLVLGFGTTVMLLWLASRIYRVGMLMYGKKATIPEAWRWLRKA